MDRCRTTNNLLGDLYGAAIVEALSKKELNAMDEERKKQKEKEDEEEMETARIMMRKDLESAIKDDDNEDDSNLSNLESPSACGSINGSSVEVPEVIVVDDSPVENVKL